MIYVDVDLAQTFLYLELLGGVQVRKNTLQLNSFWKPHKSHSLKIESKVDCPSQLTLIFMILYLYLHLC